MSHAAEAPKGAGTRIIQLFVLLGLFGMVFLAARWFPAISQRGGTIASVGLLLLAGTLASELVEVIKLPHLTGYVLAGALAGPHVLHLVSHTQVEDLSFVNSLALALIALAGGAELRMEVLRRTAKSLAWSTLLHTAFGLVGMTLVFFLARPMMPFLAGHPWRTAAGVALMWGCVAITRSPSATLGILSQTRAQGPVATFTLAFVMTSDIIVVVAFAMCLLVSRALIDPSASFSIHDLEGLAHELVGSIAIGTTLGLVLAAYIRLVGGQLILVLLLLGMGAYEVVRYLSFDALLVFMVAGFVVQNLSDQGEVLLHAIERTGGVVFVLFFAIAGAHLDLPLVKLMWPAALLLAGSRAILTLAAGRLSARLANDVPTVKSWGFSGLVSQAGLALGLVVLIEKAFPFLEGFKALGIATIAFNELFGPVLFKFALDRAGETGGTPTAVRTSLPGEEDGDVETLVAAMDASPPPPRTEHQSRA